MKVMQKELMRQTFAGAWRQKIWLEKDLMASLHHPFLVNLMYAFQNKDYLVLVMDLVPAGDLSDYVLTKKRLTADQVRTVMMEIVCVLAYCHSQSVLYRDLKPENILVDVDGHVRLIDMGLAARISAKTPKRYSRVGTDCYMAPEVRWAREKKTPYGVSCDWYTVGVLCYEFHAGDLPFETPEEQDPDYTEFAFPDPHARDLVLKLLAQDPAKRLGSGADGVLSIQRHPYWQGVEWELVPLKKFVSPCMGIHGTASKAATSKKKLKQDEAAAVDVAAQIDAAAKDAGESAPVAQWDFVSPTAITEEYMENMYHCVSAI
jgi:serine/threonine protein kinase